METTETRKPSDLLTISGERITIIYVLQAARRGLKEDISNAKADVRKYESEYIPQRKTLLEFAKAHLAELETALDGVQEKLDWAWKTDELH